MRCEEETPCVCQPTNNHGNEQTTLSGGNSKSNGSVELYRLHKIDDGFYTMSVRIVEPQHARMTHRRWSISNVKIFIFRFEFFFEKQNWIKSVSCTKFKAKWITKNSRWNRNPRLKQFNVNYILARKFVNHENKT